MGSARLSEPDILTSSLYQPAVTLWFRGHHRNAPKQQIIDCPLVPHLLERAHIQLMRALPILPRLCKFLFSRVARNPASRPPVRCR